jgi:hypothetical protein
MELKTYSAGTHNKYMIAQTNSVGTTKSLNISMIMDCIQLATCNLALLGFYLLCYE